MKASLGAFCSVFLLLLLMWVRAIHAHADNQRGFFLSLIAVWGLGIVLLHRLSRGWGKANGKSRDV